MICELFSLLLFFSTQGVRDGMAGRRLSGIGRTVSVTSVERGL